MFFIMCLVILLQYFACIGCRSELYVDYIFGQADIGIIRESNLINEGNIKYINKKSLYSGSINIIEKYLTIYMILYILSYYIKVRNIS